MICNERSTRILPGLSQALDWLRQNLPPADRALSPVLVPVPVRARPQRRRPSASAYAVHGRFGRYRADWAGRAKMCSVLKPQSGEQRTARSRRDPPGEAAALDRPPGFDDLARSADRAECAACPRGIEATPVVVP
jgi:hypothetical protein